MLCNFCIVAGMDVSRAVDCGNNNVLTQSCSSVTGIPFPKQPRVQIDPTTHLAF